MNCDVCGLPVNRKDDATMLESLVYDRSALVMFSNPRHIQCSPSRAQYIVHENFAEMIDSRQSFDKRCLPEEMRRTREVRWTSAWETLQNEYGEDE